MNSARGERFMFVRTVPTLGLALMLALANYAYALVTVSEKTAIVDVAVTTSIKAESVTPVIRKDFEQGEDIHVTAEFDVEANVPIVRVQVAATDLYFSKDPQNVDPIPLDKSRGVDVNVSGASIIGGDFNADLTNEQETVDGFIAYKTQELTFRSKKGHTFEHRFFVSVYWDSRSEEHPAGNYEGRIKFICAVEPP